MPKITATLHKIRLNARHTRELHAKLAEFNRQGAAAFIQAAIPFVPVWSGESRGSFLNVARELGLSVPISPIAPATQPRSWKFSHFGGALKTPELGALQADFLFGREGNQHTFSFFSNVYQYKNNEGDSSAADFRRSKSAPWKSFERGKLAYKAKMKELLDGASFVKSALTYVRVTEKI